MEGFLKLAVSIGGAIASYAFGGWSALMGILLTFVVIDYFSGVIAAGVEGKLKSNVGLIGIARKVFIFAMVAIAHLIDTTGVWDGAVQFIGFNYEGDLHLLRDATIFFYLANELLSITENAGRIGLPVPSPVKKAIEALKGKGE